MEFYPGFDIESREKDMEFVYGPDVFGPKPEKRTLEAIRSSLQDPSCTGPEILYSIVMDVGRKQDHTAITERNLLYGAVTYAKGTLGKEPVRSQGHIHAISPSCQSSTCEVYEMERTMRETVTQSMRKQGKLSSFHRAGCMPPSTPMWKSR